MARRDVEAAGHAVSAPPRVVVAPDKFRSTMDASGVAEILGRAARVRGYAVREVPLADGGEGTLAVLGGPNTEHRAHGPDGRILSAGWRLEGDLAVIEMARASGLTLAGGPEHNDAVAATSEGTGELIAAAIAAGARRIVVGIGGSASTDGGAGALRHLEHFAPLAGVPGRFEVVVACDVTTRFLEAADAFAPQKGARPDEVGELRTRLERLAEEFAARRGIDVRPLDGGGAGGGLAGGLAALGARLVSGFALVADLVGLAESVAGATLVVTGEGRVDATSHVGKVVGGVLATARSLEVPAGVIAGSVEPGVLADVLFVDLVATFGEARAFEDTGVCLTEAMHALLDRFESRREPVSSR